MTIITIRRMNRCRASCFTHIRFLQIKFIYFLYIFNFGTLLWRTIRRAILTTQGAHRHTYTAIGGARKYDFIVFIFASFRLFLTSSMKYFYGYVSIRNNIYLQNVEHRWAWSGVTSTRDTLLNVILFIRILPEHNLFISTD